MTDNAIQRILKNTRTLSQEEEMVLINRIKENPNDEKAKDDLIRANLKFVVKVSRRYFSQHIELTERVSMGVLGLLRCIESYDPDKSPRFILYAAWYIEDEIRNECIFHNHSIRIPPQKRALVNRFKRALNQNAGNYTKTISLPEFEPFKEDIDAVMASTSEFFPIDENPNEDDRQSIANTLPDTKNKKCNSDDIKQIIVEHFPEVLDEVEQVVIKMSYGFLCDKISTLEEIGLVIKRSKENVRVIRNRALAKLLKHEGMRKKLIHFITE